MIDSVDRELPVVLALAFGWVPETTEIDWSRAFVIARNERCAPIVWLRSATLIRQRAPSAIVDAWRREAMSAVSLSRFWEPVIDQILTVLETAAVQVTVMKGLPLSVMLYGDAAARPCFDLDLFVPLEQRAAADAALQGAGFRSMRGQPPNESSYEVTFRGQGAELELHSALLDGSLTAHLPFSPPGSVAVRVGGRTVPAHSDDQLPAFLATHLAKHKMPPLLWFLDFASLWATLDAQRRQSAFGVADRTRTRRYLDWAILNAQRVEAAANGDAAAVRALGFCGGARRDRYYAARMAALAASRSDALRVWYAWAAPKVFRSRWPTLDRQSLRHLATKISFRVRGTRQPYSLQQSEPAGKPQPDRTIRISDEEIVGLVQEMQRVSQPFWMIVDGSSMSPTIPGGTLVRFSAAALREFCAGDVVLARLVTGNCVVHRIVSVRGGEILLRGDANETADPPITRDCILAIAEQMIVDGSPVAIGIPTTPRIRRMHRMARGVYGRIASRAVPAIRRALRGTTDLPAR